MTSSVSNVLVDVVELDDNRLQIAPTERLTEQLAKRESEIRAAIAMAARIVTDSAGEQDGNDGWHVSEIEAKFGLTLSAEAGVILGKASSQAAFEITIKATKG